MADVSSPPSSQVATGTGIAQVIGSGTATVNIREAPAPIVPALHQLSAPPRDFTGREAELDDLLRAVETSGVTISGMYGLGGIGKTALALVLAQRLTPRYPDAQFYLDLRGTAPNPLTPAEAMTHVIRGYHPTTKLPEGEAELRGLYCSVLSGQRALLLMDNAADRAKVEPLLPPASCLLLVTSRQHFVLPGLYAKNMDVLPVEDAEGLLLKIAPRIGGHAAEMARLCGYLPLALRVSASALAERVDVAPGDHLRRLGDITQRLKLTGVEASLAASFELLPGELRAQWYRLAVFVGEFDRAAAAAVWAVEDEAAVDALSELARYSLVDFLPSHVPAEDGGGGGGGGRFRLHDLVHLFAGARLGQTDCATVQQRHAAHYESVLRAADELFLQGGESITRSLALFDLEWPNIQAGQAWSAAHATLPPQPETGEGQGGGDTAAQLCSDYPDTGTYMLGLRLHPRERIRWREAALAAARRVKDRSAEGSHLSNLGLAYADLGDARRAIEFHELALVISREICAASRSEAERMAARRGEGQDLGNLGNAYANLGEPRRAIEYHEQALVISREIGDRRGEGADLGNLGSAYYALGDARRGIEFYEQQLVISREIGDRQGEGAALGNLGVPYAALGDARRAIEYHEQALVIDREIGNRQGESADLGNLGNIYRDLGEPRRAIGYHEQALVIDREIGDRRGEGQDLGNLGNAYANLGEPRRAIEFYEQDLVIAREVGGRREEGQALGCLGSAYYALGDARKAIEFYEQWLVIAREIGDRRGEDNALWNMSLSLDKLGDRTQAIEYAQDALKIREQIEDPHAEKTRKQLAAWRGKK
jgi:tetratricopeptide (TPR) repeat protein